MEIYADVVFFINLLMDTFILWVVSKVANKRTKPLALFLGGFAMTLVYSVLIFTTQLNAYINVFASITIAMLGVIIAFRPKRIKEFLKLVFFSYISAFAIGGMAFGVFYFTNIENLIGNMIGTSISNFSLKILLSSTCGFYVLIKLCAIWLKRVGVKKQTFFNVTVHLDQENTAFKALLDTGNSLEDPIDKTPVLIAEFSAVKNFLPDSLKLLFYENNEGDYSEVVKNIEGTAFCGRIRMIPFSSLGEKHGMLLGFRPDWIEIENHTEILKLEHVIIGIYNYTLSLDGGYQALLQPQLLKA